MTFNVHAGHGAVGKGAIGAVGVLNESIEDRKVKDVVIKWLRSNGHRVYDTTVDCGTASQVLNGIVNKCNANKVDLDISIHFNAGVNRPYKDGVTTGVEVYCYNPGSTNAVDAAKRIVNNISALGFKNRGVKFRRDLYFLAKTNAQALLIECCFVDDGDDAAKYNAESMGKAIAEGIINKRISTQLPESITVEGGVYRLYDAKKGDHMFTTDVNERNTLLKNGWGDEGVSWKAPKTSKIPVFRLYNPNDGRHLFTAGIAEKNNVMLNGWKYEGIAYFSDEAEHTPVHRLYNKQSGEHFYTPSSIEQNNLIKLGWVNEGVAFFGV